MNARNNKNKGKDGKTMGCWTCGGPHLAKSCPNRERVNVMLAGNVNQGEGEQEVVAALANPLGWSLNQFSLLNVVGDSPKSFNPHSTLIHIEMKVDGNGGYRGHSYVCGCQSCCKIWIKVKEKSILCPNC